MRNRIINFFNNKKTISYMIIILASIFICTPLFLKNMDMSRDDGIQHICRIIGTHLNIKHVGIFNPIISNFCNGFGYSWSIFYSPLTAYIPLVFKIFTQSYVTALKLFMYCTILLSGICTYKLVYSISKSNKASIISAIIYMCTPYHLTDLYNRIAIAELASFVFLPLVFLGLYDLFYKKGKKAYYISIGAIGLIISHNVLAVYTAIFSFIYLILHYKKLKKRKVVKTIILNLFIIILCTSFYWIPLLEHYFATTYEVFVPGRMFQNNTLISSKLSFLDLIFTKHFGMIFHIGLPTIIGIMLIFMYRKQINVRYKYTIYIFFAFGIISIIMTLKIFPYEHLPNFLKMIQFGWRMLEFSSLFLSIVAGIGIAIFLNSSMDIKLKTLVEVILIIYTIILLKDSVHTVEIPFNEQNYINPIPVTSQTGKIHAGLASFEYLPQRAFQNRNYIETRNNDIIIIDGKCNINNIEKENSNLKFNLQDVEVNTKLELPFIYYLGYSAKLEKHDGTTKKLKIQESEKGFCLIQINKEDKGTVNMEYTGTILMKIAYILTATGIIILFTMKLTKVT